MVIRYIEDNTSEKGRLVRLTFNMSSYKILIKEI